MARIGKTEEYSKCAEAGMTFLQTAKACGVTDRSVRDWAKRAGVMFAGYEPHTTSGMTPAQRADYDTYIKARVGHDDALRMVLTPKVKIRAVPKGMVAK